MRVRNSQVCRNEIWVSSLHEMRTRGYNYDTHYSVIPRKPQYFMISGFQTALHSGAGVYKILASSYNPGQFNTSISCRRVLYPYLRGTNEANSRKQAIECFTLLFEVNIRL